MRAGSAWTRRRDCSPARATSRWPPHRVRRARLPSPAAPIRAKSTLEFSNTVTRIHEDPRVTLPYTDEAWATIQDVARGVDERLTDGDVRLTVGGEPTFVSVDNQVDDEWSTAPTARTNANCASELAARLKEQWAPQGLVHRGQGRWYPGEPLPRWQIGLYWRTDGQPLWPDDTLLADPWGTDPAGPPADSTAAHDLLAAIAAGLGLADFAGASGLRRSAVAAGGRKPVCPKATRWHQMRIWTRRPARTPPPAARSYWPASTNPPYAPTAFVLAAAPPRGRRLGWASANWRLRRGRIVLVDGRLAGGPAAATGLDQLEAAAADVRHRPDHRRRRVAPRPPSRGAGRGRRHRADDRDGRRGARRAAVRVHAADRGAGPLRRSDRPGARRGGEDRLPGRHRRLRPAAGPAADVDDDHPRPGCHRSQRRTHRQFRRAEPTTRNPLRTSQIGPAVHGVVPVRRQPRRHRRRQPHHSGRRHPEGLAATAPARLAGLAADLLAAAPGVVLPVRRVDSSAPPRRRRGWTRAAPRRSTNSKSRSPKSTD